MPEAKLDMGFFPVEEQAVVAMNEELLTNAFPVEKQAMKRAAMSKKKKKKKRMGRSS